MIIAAFWARHRLRRLQLNVRQLLLCSSSAVISIRV